MLSTCLTKTAFILGLLFNKPFATCGMRTYTALLFVFLHIGISNSATCQNTDIDWLRTINLERNRDLDGPFAFLSNTTIYPVIGLPIAATCTGMWKKKPQLRSKGMEMAVACLSNAIITYSVKSIANRTRPYITYPELDNYHIETSASLPSGHSSNSFALATSLSLQFPRWYVAVPSYLWAASVAYSRMHLGVHYPSDVTAGCLIGTGTSLLTHWANQKLQQRKSTRKEILKDNP